MNTQEIIDESLVLGISGFSYADLYDPLKLEALLTVSASEYFRARN